MYKGSPGGDLRGCDLFILQLFDDPYQTAKPSDDQGIRNDRHDHKQHVMHRSSLLRLSIIISNETISRTFIEYFLILQTSNGTDPRKAESSGKLPENGVRRVDILPCFDRHVVYSTIHTTPIPT